MWFDLHTAPQSQNGFDNSGRLGRALWDTSPGYVNRTLRIVNSIAAQVVADGIDDVVTGFGLLNEPDRYLVPSILRDYYAHACVSRLASRRKYTSLSPRLRSLIAPFPATPASRVRSRPLCAMSRVVRHGWRARVSRLRLPARAPRRRTRDTTTAHDTHMTAHVSLSLSSSLSLSGRRRYKIVRRHLPEVSIYVGDGFDTHAREPDGSCSYSRDG